LQSEKDGQKVGENAIGVAIDEESSFLHLNGYLMYRHGLGVYQIQTLAEMKEVLCGSVTPEYILEDMELRFQDADKIHGEDYFLFPIPEIKSRSELYKAKEYLENRKNQFCGLSELNGKKRVFVTAFAGRLRDSKEFNNSQSWFVDKPFAGMFDSAFDKLRERDFVCVQKENNHSHSAPDHSHSASGRIQCIAEILVNRATLLLNSEKKFLIENAIHAAVLAEEARRLLAGNTPTLSLWALALRHKAEVLAECSFIGTSSDMDVEARLEELSDSIGNIITDKRKIINAQIEIAGVLRRCYKECEQYDEEEKVNQFIIQTRAKLLINQDKPSHNIIGYILFPFVCYFNKLTKSVFRILFVSSLWILFFGLVFLCFDYSTMNGFKTVWTSGKGLQFVFECMFRSWSAFIMGVTALGEIAAPLTTFSEGTGLSFSLHWVFFWTIQLLESTIGLIHLGLLISVFYSRIARK
jgi:hypothetical protein